MTTDTDELVKDLVAEADTADDCCGPGTPIAQVMRQAADRLVALEAEKVWLANNGTLSNSEIVGVTPSEHGSSAIGCADERLKKLGGSRSEALISYSSRERGMIERLEQIATGRTDMGALTDLGIARELAFEALHAAGWPTVRDCENGSSAALRAQEKREPLHPRVGKQLLVLRGAKVADNWPKDSDSICLIATRENMEQLWAVLNDLQDASAPADSPAGASPHD